MGPQGLLIRYADGRRAECILLRLCGRVIRALIAGAPDAVEFRLVLDDWVSDRGDVVSFEFVAPASCALTHIVDSRPECAAGGACMLRRIGGFAGPAN